MSGKGKKALLLPSGTTVLDDGISYDELMIDIHNGKVPCFSRIHWSVWNFDDDWYYDVIDGKCVASADPAKTEEDWWEQHSPRSFN
jgi:hypothetical protein